MTSPAATLLNARRRRGFTLIEVIVVLIVIGVLTAVAARLLSGPSDAAKDRVSATSLEQITQAQTTFATTHGTFTGWPDDLTLPAGVSATVEASTTFTQVSVALGDRGTLGLAARVSDDRCALRVVEGFGQAAQVTDEDARGSTSCEGTSALKLLTTDEAPLPPTSQLRTVTR